MELEEIRKKVKEIFEEYDNNILKILGHISNLKENLDLKKSILNLNLKFTLTELLFHILNNFDFKCPICATCKEEDVKFINFINGYRKFCSKKCFKRNNDIKEKYKKTCLQKYGIENIFQNNEIRDKIKQTNLEKFGVEYPYQNEVIRKKGKLTCLKNFGVDNPSKNVEICDKRNKTFLEKFGVDNPLKNKEIQEKIKQTNLEKYGFEQPSKSKEIRDKIKQTNLERYGVESVIKNDKIEKKIKQINQERLNVDYPFQSKVVQDKIKQKHLIKYGGNPSKNFDIIGKIKEKNLLNIFDKFLLINRFTDNFEILFNKKDYLGTKKFKYFFKCKKCNNIFICCIANGKIPRCFKCNPIFSGKSKNEGLIETWLKEKDVQNIIRNDRQIIPPLELDFYIPDYNLAIEFNGLFWHSELNGKDKYYHLDKIKQCALKGIQLLHIYEDEWINKQDIVKSIISNKLGLIQTKIFARDCMIKEVNKDECQTFLSLNHLQGIAKIKYNYGLYFNNDLVQVICLSKSRYNKNYDFELIRSCSKLNTVVIGGFDRLINNLPIQGSIVSYVDRRYFNGKGYKNWKYLGETSPNYYYTKDYINRESRLKYQKHKLAKLFNDQFDLKLTEWQNMQLVGYDRIWDCGNLVYFF